jgi:Mrp family chromosome partitioning ATPase
MAVSERLTSAAPTAVASRGTGLLITDSSCPPSIRDAYKETFLSIRFAQLSGTGPTLLLSAVDGSASAAALAANLAILAAQEQERVILVDADPYAPTLDSLFDLGPSDGFTNLIRNEGPDVAAVLHVVAAQPTLRVMSAGTAGGVPGGIGHARGLAELLIRLKNAADRVILIGAPILTHVDSMALCPLVDGVVVTVTPGKTHRLDARRAREILDRVGSPLLGVVLTQNTP